MHEISWQESDQSFFLFLQEVYEQGEPKWKENSDCFWKGKGGSSKQSTVWQTVCEGTINDYYNNYYVQLCKNWLFFYDGSLDNLLNNQEHLNKQWRGVGCT